MTSPGPQQPDEVEHVCDDYETDDVTRWADELDNPAAPSAQPDEVQRFDTGSPDECGPGFIPMYRVPAQPVRDTEDN